MAGDGGHGGSGAARRCHYIHHLRVYISDKILEESISTLFPTGGAGINRYR